jgi:DNA-binding transcriptional LysR family regulator
VVQVQRGAAAARVVDLELRERVARLGAAGLDGDTAGLPPDAVDSVAGCDAKQLRVLQTVGETGSFSAAADRLDYTQPAVSKIVATLERQLGTTLVDRGIRPLRLTEAGNALTHRAATAFEQLAAAELEVEAIANLTAGSLRVGTFSSAGAAMVVDALRAFRRSHPDVDVTIREIGLPSALTRTLRSGDLDVGVSFDYPELGDTFADDLDLEHLLDDPFDVVVPRGHRLERNGTVRFADLRRETWLLGDFGADSPSFRMIDRRCRDAGFDPNVAYRINDCQMTQALVAAGEGIAVLPRLMLRAAHPGVAIRPLAADPPSRRVSAVRLATRYLTPATERFIALLVEASVENTEAASVPRS